MRIALVVVLLAGCPSPPPRPQPVQRTANDGTCEEVAWSCVTMQPNSEEPWGCIEGNESQTAQYQASCTPAKHGRFALGPCLRDHLIGGCTLARGSTCTTTWYYPPATRVTVEADCLKASALFVAP